LPHIIALFPVMARHNQALEILGFVPPLAAGRPIRGAEYFAALAAVIVRQLVRAPDGRPYLKTYALTNIAWDEAIRAFYECHAPEGMVFTNLDTLFGAAMTSGEPVIANDPAQDPCRGGLPEGHPPLDAFLGLPIHRGGKPVTMIGLANRPGGYDPVLVSFLQPRLVTLGQLVEAAR
jgi:hypothetical protein